MRLQSCLLSIALIVGFGVAPLAGQSLTLSGSVTNLGTLTESHEPVSGSLVIATGPMRDDSPYLAIGDPLGGSGRAVVFCWNDSLLIASTSTQGDTIAWLGARDDDAFHGEYVITGGDSKRQGGTWQLDYPGDQADALERICHGRPKEKTVRGLVRLTASFRDGQSSDMASREPENRTGFAQPTTEELTEMVAATASLNRYVKEEMRARALLPLITQHLVDAGINDAEAARAEGKRLAQDGLMRLGPDEQWERLQFWGDVLLNLDQATCERWVDLDVSRRGLYLISRFSDEQLRKLAAWQTRAVQAELEADRPAVTQSRDGLSASLARIAANLGEGDGRRLLDLLENYSVTSVTDRCWVERSMIRGALAEKGSARAQLAATYWVLAAGGGKE